MAHNDWCGKPCCECEDNCKLDENIPCSPDCDNLCPDGSRDFELCFNSGCDTIIQSLGDAFYEQFMSDDNKYEDKYRRVLEQYVQSTEETKAIIDDLFMSLCGWSLDTLARGKSVLLGRLL